MTFEIILTFCSHRFVSAAA